MRMSEAHEGRRRNRRTDSEGGFFGEAVGFGRENGEGVKSAAGVLVEGFGADGDDGEEGGESGSGGVSPLAERLVGDRAGRQAE